MAVNIPVQGPYLSPDGEALSATDPSIQIPDEDMIFKAVRFGDVMSIERLLRQGTDINIVHTG
jgi:hypothetical protein